MTKGSCKLDGCNHPTVGKGYCARHYRKWRKGQLPKARYKICTEEGCRKPRSVGSKCADHAGRAAAAGAEAGPAN